MKTDAERKEERQRRIDETARCLFVIAYGAAISKWPKSEWAGPLTETREAYDHAETLESERARRLAEEGKSDE